MAIGKRVDPRGAFAVSCTQKVFGRYEVIAERVKGGPEP